VSATVGCSSAKRDSQDSASHDAAPEGNAGAPVVVAAGDIAICYGTGGDEATSRLLSDIEGTVLTLGDNAYQDGNPEEFTDCYGPSWGRYKDRTKPSPGNHDYHTEGAQRRGVGALHRSPDR
jgi:hypothetical protein